MGLPPRVHYCLHQVMGFTTAQCPYYIQNKVGECTVACTQSSKTHRQTVILNKRVEPNDIN